MVFTPKSNNTQGKTSSEKSSQTQTFSTVIKKELDYYDKRVSDIIIHIEEKDIPMMREVEKLRQKYLDNTFYLILSNKPQSWMKLIVEQK